MILCMPLMVLYNLYIGPFSQMYLSAHGVYANVIIMLYAICYMLYGVRITMRVGMVLPHVISYTQH